MTQLALDLCGRETMIERTQLGHGFQGWLAEWADLERDGWCVAVIVDRGETHAVGLACREVTL